MFCEITSLDLSYVVPVKSTVEILQNFVAFSEYMNFKVKPEKIQKQIYIGEIELLVLFLQTTNFPHCPL